MRPFSSSALLASVLFCGLLQAQTGSHAKGSGTAWSVPGDDGRAHGQLEPGEDPDNHLVSPFLGHIAGDQKRFWTFPARLRVQDLKWIVPAAGASAVLLASDSWISRQVPDKPNQLNFSQSLSNYGVYSIIGAGGGAFLLGSVTGDDHMRETGLLAAEAAINATGVAYAFKLAANRQRPFLNRASGDFFAGKLSDSSFSFPSEHAAIAWSIASVVAHEYPGPMTKLAAYGLATLVSATRVTGREHFPSDVLIGGAIGWYFGHQVFRARHDPELGGAAWGSYFDPDYEPKSRDPRNMGSPYVPPDSWIYPLFDRLQALGIVKTAYLGLRPWTRMECARLLEEAGETIGSLGADNDGARIYRELEKEFNAEIARLSGAANLGVRIDSAYVRAAEISGTPLTDGYHFAQTLTNDYGRPYGQGFNTVAGLTAYAVAGPFSFSLQGEYQHAPAVPGYGASVAGAIAAADATTPYPYGKSQVNRIDLLDSTVSVQYHNLQISAGKQSQWWSMTEAGPLLMSDNAEPMVSLKLDNVSPYHVPLISTLLGDARSEYFIGRLDGHVFEANGTQLLGPGNIHPQPFIQGIKVSFKPTGNLELGFGFTAMFAGPGLPFTLRNFARTFYAHTASAITNPGKRATSFDFRYRIPGLRNWLSVYNDSLAVDEYSPIGSSRPSLNLGLYLAKLPKLNQMDFRAEIIGTPHDTREFAPGFVYYDLRRFRNGYTNDGNLLGSWIGRAGRGGQGWLTYWFSPRSTVQFGYRYQKVSRDFLEGGHLDDFSVRPSFMLSSHLSLSGAVQFEHWYFPLLSAEGHSNALAEAGLTFYPHWQLRP